MSRNSVLEELRRSLLGAIQIDYITSKQWTTTAQMNIKINCQRKYRSEYHPHRHDSVVSDCRVMYLII